MLYYSQFGASRKELQGKITMSDYMLSDHERDVLTKLNIDDKGGAPDKQCTQDDHQPEEIRAVWVGFVPGFHEYFIARARYIDDYLATLINDGLQQLVILGAGFDSRAYRFESLRETTGRLQEARWRVLPDIVCTNRVPVSRPIHKAHYLWNV